MVEFFTTAVIDEVEKEVLLRGTTLRTAVPF